MKNTTPNFQQHLPRQLQQHDLFEELSDGQLQQQDGQLEQHELSEELSDAELLRISGGLVRHTVMYIS